MELSLEGVYVAVNQAYRDTGDRSWADYELGPSPARPTVDSHVVQASKMAEEELSAWADFTQELRDRAARRRGPG